MRLFIDSGHQPGVDPGAVSPQCVEVDHNVAIREALRKYINFVDVPNNTTLDQRIQWINQNSTHEDILISIHTNAGGGNGVESWYYGGYEPGKDNADLLTRLINNNVLEPSRPSKPDTASRFGRFGIIRLTHPQAYLVECGFVDSPDQNDTIPEKTEGYAKGIAEFCASFGFPLKQQAPAQPVQEPPKVDTPIAPNPPQATQAILSSTVANRYVFNKNLYPGLMQNADVVALQMFLKEKGFFPQEMSCTGNYLANTKLAVARYQVQNHILPNLVTYGSGYFGPKTREFINNNERTA